jgi:tRNA threonylcarbamoyladenosine biosynthesis protein TsaE
MAQPTICAAPNAVFDLPDSNATAAFGARLAAVLWPGDVVFLRGELGAGKTTLARGLIEAWTGESEAPSPTYTLVQVYEGPRGALWHMDLYRLADPGEAIELGLEEAMGAALLVIEWPERLGPLAPPDRIEVRLAPLGAGRIAELYGVGRYAGFRLDA